MDRLPDRFHVGALGLTAFIRMALARIVLALILMAATLLLVGMPGGSLAYAEVYRTEKLTFITNVVRGTTSNSPVRIEAQLYLPVAASQPLPAVVIMPSSSGVEDEREIYYAIELSRAGIAALVVDSFSSRGVGDTLYDQSALETWDMENDAIAALRKLTADRRIDALRIAILGVSKGGTVARDAALTVRRKWMSVDGVVFAAHVAISPDCTWTNRSAATTGAPIFFMLAELDDQTPASACLEQAARIVDGGNSGVETKVYPGAHHAWEELGAGPEYDRKVENYSKCRVWIEDDGLMHNAVSGELVPERTWRTWARRTCMTRGATCCGGTPELKAAATSDIIAFLRKRGF